MTYRAAVDRMFDRVTEQIHDITEIYVDNVVEDVVQTTPGPNLQYPLTEYIATGRLRGGWQSGTQAPARVPINRDAETMDEDGHVTIAKVMSTFKIQPKWSMWNNIGYGWYVYYGAGTHQHIGPRPWIELAALRAAAHFENARSRVMRG